MTTKQEIVRLIKEGVFDANLTQQVIDKVRIAHEKMTPILLDGQAGSGKTAAVYYYAHVNDIEVVEFNASDDLRKEEKVRHLKQALIEKHSAKVRFVLLDEIDKKSNLPLLTKLVAQNRVHAPQTGTIIIAITNYGWTLRKRHKIGEGRSLSFVEAFGANSFKVYRPYSSNIAKSIANKTRKRINTNKKISNDLRDYEAMLVSGEFATQDDNLSGLFKTSFALFEEFMRSPAHKRRTVPTAKDLGGSLEKWVLKNGLSNMPENFLRWWKSDFHQAVEILAYANYYEEDLLKLFLPSFWVQFGSFKHPSSL